jgi:hypothetical protein
MLLTGEGIISNESTDLFLLSLEGSAEKGERGKKPFALHEVREMSWVSRSTRVLGRSLAQRRV